MVVSGPLSMNVQIVTHRAHQQLAVIAAFQLAKWPRKRKRLEKLLKKVFKTWAYTL